MRAVALPDHRRFLTLAPARRCGDPELIHPRRASPDQPDGNCLQATGVAATLLVVLRFASVPG